MQIRLTEEDLLKNISSIEYYITNPRVTQCLIIMNNGFIVSGTSIAPFADSADQKVGEKLAYNNAFIKLWGYTCGECYYAVNDCTLCEYHTKANADGDIFEFDIPSKEYYCGSFKRRSK